jgi:hypothetical protein
MLQNYLFRVLSYITYKWKNYFRKVENHRMTVTRETIVYADCRVHQINIIFVHIYPNWIFVKNSQELLAEIDQLALDDRYCDFRYDDGEYRFFKFYVSVFIKWQELIHSTERSFKCATSKLIFGRDIFGRKSLCLRLCEGASSTITLTLTAFPAGVPPSACTPTNKVGYSNLI